MGTKERKNILNSTLRRFSSIRLAIFELLLIGAVSALGTVIEQDRPIAFYKTFYPDGEYAIFGFLSWDIITSLGLDRIYSRPAYYLLIFLLGISLMACTVTRQWPALRNARKSGFSNRSERVKLTSKKTYIEGAKLRDLGRLLGKRGYQVLGQNESIYAFRGITSRFAPIIVHIALIIILVGTTISSAGSWRGVVMTPEGGDFLIINHINPATPLALLPNDAKTVVSIDS